MVCELLFTSLTEHNVSPSKFAETRQKYLLLLLSMKVNVENKYILFCTMALSGILEVGAPKMFWGKPQHSFSILLTSRRIFWYKGLDLWA